MKFESLMAVRYIFKQKRHSLLTIISIFLALSLMTALFTGYYTLTCVLREVNYANNPYHVRIYDLTKEQAESIKSYDHIDTVEFKEFIAGNTQTDIMLKKGMKDFLTWFQQLLKDKELGFESVDYDRYDINMSLKNYDLIDDEARFNQLQLLCILYVFIIFIAMSLRMIIDTAFEISSKERERQFGMLESIGASPKQIVRIITLEGLMLCIVGVPLGLLGGIGSAWLAFRSVLSSGIAETFIAPALAKRTVTFHISPMYLALSAVTGLVWVLLSAYGTGMRVIKISPVQAITSGGGVVKKVRRRSLAGLIFGWKGKLASRNVRRQPKRFIITVLSLTLSLSLYSSVEVVVDNAQIATKKMIMMDTGSDEGVMLLSPNISADPLAYKDTVENLKKTGYFKAIGMDILGTARLKENGINTDGRSGSTYYVNKDWYEPFFKVNYGLEPPMTYEELEASGGFIAVSLNGDPIDLKEANCLYFGKNYSDDDLKKLEKVYSDGEVDDDEFKVLREAGERAEKRNTEKKVKIAASVKIDDSAFGRYGVPAEGTVDIVAPVSMYENGDYELFGSYQYPPSIYAEVVDNASYSAALKYVEEPKHKVEMFFDAVGLYQDMDAVFTGIRLGSAFLNIFIALIAMVNLVNIITTGLINRKSELASMQCVGMTEGQLYGMSIVECLQFVITAAVFSVILCILLIIGTEAFVHVTGLAEDGIKLGIGYFEPVPKILLGSAAAFAVSTIASLLTLRNMQKTEPVERLRSVD